MKKNYSLNIRKLQYKIVIPFVLSEKYCTKIRKMRKEDRVHCGIIAALLLTPFTLLLYRCDQRFPFVFTYSCKINGYGTGKGADKESG